MTPLKYSRRRLAVNGSLAALVLAGAGVAYATVGPANSATASTLRTTPVQQGTVTASVSASGNLALAATSTLAFGAAGKVSEIDVKVGQQVTAGQTLAKIDPTQANLQLTEAQQQLTVAQDNLAKAQNGPNSAQQAVNQAQLTQDETALSTAQQTLSDDENLPTVCPSSSPSSSSSSKTCQTPTLINQDKQAVTNAQNSLNLLKAQQAQSAYVDPATIAQDQEAVTQAQAAVNNAQTAVAATAITAPTAGTILTVAGQVGSEVSAGTSTTGASSSSSSGSGSSGSGGSGSGASGSGSGSGSSSNSSSSSSSSGSFITMADLSQLQVTADVSETDVSSVKLGQTATLNLNAVPGSNYAAQVTAISPTSTVVSNVVEYAVTLSITDTVPASVRPGQSAAITIVTGQAANAIYIPSSAITTVGGRSIVTVQGSDGKQTITQVTTGLVGTTDTQITSGLTVGERVVISLNTSTTGTNGRGFGGLGGGGLGGGGLGGAGTTVTGTGGKG